MVLNVIYVPRSMLFTKFALHTTHPPQTFRPLPGYLIFGMQLYFNQTSPLVEIAQPGPTRSLTQIK